MGKNIYTKFIEETIDLRSPEIYIHRSVRPARKMTMASPCAMIERRRSSRVAVRISIKLLRQAGRGAMLDLSAETVAISRCGALFRVRSSSLPGTRFEVLNGISTETREFRVVRVNDTKTRGLFEWGVEILYPCVNFWGVQFPDEC